MVQTYPIYLLKLLNFIGEVTFADQDTIMLEIMRQTQEHYIRWVWPFLVKIDKDQMYVNRAKQKFGMNLGHLAEKTRIYF